MRHTVLALALVIPLAACSGDDEGGGEHVSGAGDGDGDTTGDGDGDGDPSGDGDGDDDTPGDGDGDPTGDGDGDDTTGDGDGDDTSGDGDGDDPSGDGDGDGDVDTSTYQAVVMPGGIDRITITRTNVDEPSCTRLVLRRPGFDMFGITKPMDWGIEEVRTWQQGFCPMDNSNPTAYPEDGSGSISVGSWDAVMSYPCTLNFDLEMDMNTNPPSSTTWKKQGVPVQGVNCG